MIINFIILITLYLCFGIVVPFVIMSRLKANVIEKSNIALKIVLLVLYTVIFYFVIYIGFELFGSAGADTKSGLCRNLGGFIYTCLIDNEKGFVALLIILITVVIYTIFCKKIIYELFINDYKIIKYVIAVLYYLFLMLVFIYFDFAIIRGLFISYYFDLDVLNYFRYFVGLSPILIFPFLVYRDYICKKDMFIKGEK